jgi:hypothetical protein
MNRLVRAHRLVRPHRNARAPATPTPGRASVRDGQRGHRWGPIADDPILAGDPTLADGPTLSERLTLIEFSWAGQAGIQPVILVARTLLH